MDIHSGGGYPAAALSNFAAHPFTFRDLQVNSMEGFLQGLKFENPEVQASVFLLVGLGAKYRGKPKKWWVHQELYFQGQPIGRHSQEYQGLLDEAYQAMFEQCEPARKALLATQNAVLTHSIGKSDASHTVLTVNEFCGRLMHIRTQLQKLET